MEKFIELFKNELEDISTEITPETNYVNSEFWDSLTAVTVQMMIQDNYEKHVEIKEPNSFKDFGCSIPAKRKIHVINPIQITVIATPKNKLFLFIYAQVIISKFKFYIKLTIFTSYAKAKIKSSYMKFNV